MFCLRNLHSPANLSAASVRGVNTQPAPGGDKMSQPYTTSVEGAGMAGVQPLTRPSRTTCSQRSSVGTARRSHLPGGASTTSRVGRAPRSSHAASKSSSTASKLPSPASKSSSVASKSHQRAGIREVPEQPAKIKRGMGRDREVQASQSRGGEEVAVRKREARRDFVLARVVGGAWAPICAFLLPRLVRLRVGLPGRVQPQDYRYAFWGAFLRYNTHYFCVMSLLTCLAAAQSPPG